MKKLTLLMLLLVSAGSFAQQDSLTTYKKRVLETTEVDVLFSYYKQDGVHAAVSGGEGDEHLTDITPTLVVNIPLNDDDVITVDAGISAYTSASSSNIDPFDGSGQASPWVESSGASRSDALVHFNPSYAHSSDDRNKIWSANLNLSAEYDYFSVGFGGGYTRLFNEKNTEVGIKAQVYLDTWNPQYPIELRNGFSRPDIVGNGTYNPLFSEFSDLSRNSYSVSFSLSQIFSKYAQGSIFLDLIRQDGLLSTPHQRVYFGDREDFFVQDFQLADDVERLPDTRFKIPIGARFNYYLNDLFTLRTYYRFYTDDWGITAHTASIEVPIKLNERFTVYPMYRYYNQSAADYFAAKEEHISTEQYYTSDYDLSKFDSHQYGIGFTYKDIFTKAKVWKFGLKSIDLRFNRYTRSDGLDAYIGAFGIEFVQY